MTPTAAAHPALARLCILSFINQGVVFPVYALGIVLSAVLARSTPEEVEALVRSGYGSLFHGAQLDQMLAVADLLRTHGPLLMSVLALRTVGRFIGVLRMWRLKNDGFHIYTTSQLLGILLPMIIGGPLLFSWLGTLVAVMWCYLYWSQRQRLTA